MAMLNEIRAQVRQLRPLIHCITNPISIHQCANAILAVGARPIMAEHPLEVREITRTSGALVLNLGNITDVRMRSMPVSLAAAREYAVPVVLDAVGAGCSTLRRDFVLELLRSGGIGIVKGNYSEICALERESCRSSGVDADASISEGALCRSALALAKRYRCVVLASGKHDIVTDGRKTLRIQNGSPQLAEVTGTGCMLGALCGAYSAAQPGMNAAVTACAVLGICGQIAQTELGSGSFMLHLMDALSTLSDADIEKYTDLEEIHLEAF